MTVVFMQPREGPDASKPPLDTLKQVCWRLRVDAATEDQRKPGVYTNFYRCWFGFEDSVIRYITDDIYDRIMKGERDDTPITIRCSCGHSIII